LRKYTNVTTRSPLLKSIVDVINTSNEILILVADDQAMKDWSDEMHWARFLLRIKSLYQMPEHSLLDSAKIRGEHPVWGTLWVLAKIILRNRRPADMKRLLKKLGSRATRASKRALIASTKGATLDTSAEKRRQGARAAVHTVSGRGGSKHIARPAPKKFKSTATVSDTDDDDSVNNDTNDDAEGQPDQPAKTILEFTDEEVIASYVEEMDRAAAQLAKDPAQKERMQRASLTMPEYIRSLRRRPRVQKAYYRNLKLLHNVTLDHIDQIYSISKRNKRLNPIKKAAVAEFDRNSKSAGLLSKPVEEDVPQSRDVIDVLTREEEETVRQRATTESSTGVKEDPDDLLSPMIDIPTTKTDDATSKMFQDAKNNCAFAPTYLTLACIEAKILDMRRKTMPGMKLALRWWQVIGTKWISDLAKSVLTMWTNGGCLADQIGLGKTFQAGAAIAKVRPWGHFVKFEK
jgi:hypothetical protein